MSMNDTVKEWQPEIILLIKVAADTRDFFVKFL